MAYMRYSIYAVARNDGTLIHTHTTILRLCGLCPENPGELVPEETFTHYTHCGHQSSLSPFSIYYDGTLIIVINI